MRASGERTPPRPYYSTPAVPWLVVVSSTRLVTTTKEEVLQYVLLYVLLRAFLKLTRSEQVTAVAASYCSSSNNTQPRQPTV